MIGFIEKHTNCNLAYRNRRTPWLPLWGSWLPRKGQTERAEWFNFECYVLLSYCVTLSVSLFGCQLSQRESQGRCRARYAVFTRYQNRRFNRKTTLLTAKINQKGGLSWSPIAYSALSVVSPKYARI